MNILETNVHNSIQAFLQATHKKIKETLSHIPIYFHNNLFQLYLLLAFHKSHLNQGSKFEQHYSQEHQDLKYSNTIFVSYIVLSLRIIFTYLLIQNVIYLHSFPVNVASDLKCYPDLKYLRREEILENGYLCGRTFPEIHVISPKSMYEIWIWVVNIVHINT